MRTTALLSLAALSAAFILPDEQVSHLQHVEIQTPNKLKEAVDRLPSKKQVFHDLQDTIEHVSEEIHDTFDHVKEELDGYVKDFTQQGSDTLDQAFSSVEDAEHEVRGKVHDAYASTREWFNSAKEEAQDYLDDITDDDYELGPLGHHGHHGHHGHYSNKTVYELIASSNYTTILAKLINKYDDLVEALNGTAANYTVFAPTDKAFEKLGHPKHKPSKEAIKKLLSYHVSPEFYPAGRILVSRTIPTLLKSESLGKEPLPQRLVTNIGFRGLTVNYLSKVVAANFFGSNGVIHGVNFPLFPPPSIVTIIDLLPQYLSTLELGLLKTGLLDTLNTTDHAGGTFFAPSNDAFKKLGPKANAFLFSKYGLKYLKALLKYHVVPEHTLYTDAYYKPHSDSSDSDFDDATGNTCSAASFSPLDLETKKCKVPKGFYHVDLPTLLTHDEHNYDLSIDIARFGRLIDIKINGFARVYTADAVAEDGVLHATRSVLIPPKKLASGEVQEWDGEDEEIDVDDLMERLEPFVVDEDFDVEDEWNAEEEEL